MVAKGTHSSSSIPRSIEVEYWVIDEQGYLTTPGGLVDCPGAEREFVKPLVEIKTTPCTSSAELRRTLLTRIQRVVERAHSEGKQLVPLSTPLHAEEIEDFDTERTEIQDVILGEDLEYVRHCAGTHIHIEQQPGNAVDQLNTLIALDPALALVNSSPYYKGEKVAPGARSALYRGLAYQTLPMQGQLWPYASKREEYAQRVQRCYEEFVTAALIHEIERERVESTFTPEGAVWTPVQFRHQFSTVEWRSLDTSLPSHILQLADDIVSIVDTAVSNGVRIEGTTGQVTDDAVILPQFETIEHYVDSAINEGLSQAVQSYLERMGFDISAYDPLTVKLAAEAPITPEKARTLRLEYAERLEADIEAERAIIAE